MWFSRYRGSNTNALPPAEREARRTASKARTYAKQRAIADDASDAGTPIARLRELLVRHPARVLANPAWQLASVTDLGLVGSLPGQALEVLAGHPGADASTLMMVAQQLVRRHASYRTDCPGAVHAVATRADVPVEVLRVLAEGRDRDRMGNPGFEVAYHRVRWFEAGDESLAMGWRDALPAMMVDATARLPGNRQWSFLPGHFERVLAHDPARSAHPFILGLVLRAPPGPRAVALHCVRSAGHDPDERWLWAHAVCAVRPPSDWERPGWLSHHWKACVSTWERDFHSFGLSSRCSPRAMGEAQGRRAEADRMAQWVAEWRRGEVEGKAPNAEGPERPAWESGLELDGASPFNGTSGSHLAELALVCEDATMLGRRSRDGRWWVRAAAAMNPALGEMSRARLCGDHHWAVRAMAREARDAGRGSQDAGRGALQEGRLAASA